ncbi:hypothetical protein JTB14_029655 [Gonioctena quinquepunctata]|nr:hypothetical protein JTB14_029655 [Gonioctena quinquepunctata]
MKTLRFQKSSSSENYDPLFQISKNERGSEINTKVPLPYNMALSLKEFEEALDQATNTTPGPDRIPYDFIKNLLPPPFSKNTYCVPIIESGLKETITGSGKKPSLFLF